MSNSEQKKLKGIVSISSEDYISKSEPKNQNISNNNDNQKVDSNESQTKSQTTPSKTETKPKAASTSSSKGIQLPDKFFEHILDCEFKLKEKFDVKTFYQLINLYSSAINFYESIKDPRFITYNQSLNLLFSMPEVKKFMEGKKSLTKKEKQNDLEKRLLQSEKKITKERVNKIYLSKLQKNLGKNIISDEFNKQSNLFKKRKEEKKKKYLLSTSAIASGKKQDFSEENHKDENNNIINEKKRIKNANKTIDVIKTKNDNDDNDTDNENDNNNSEEDKEDNDNNGNEDKDGKNKNFINLNKSDGPNNVLDELRKEDIKNEINKITINGSGHESANNNLDDTLSFSNSDNILVDLSKLKKITTKTLFQENLKSILDKYINEINEIFLEKTINLIIKDYTVSGNDVEKKFCESAVNSYNQQKEMEYLLNGDENDETYNDQIESMIQQIKDEEEEAELKIFKEAEQREKILNDKYINSINNFHNHKLELLKEKLKLEVTKSVNSIILK